MLVVDASVAVKWFIPEPDSDKATTLLSGASKLIAPELIQLEVASALTRLYRMKLLDMETVSLLLQDWRNGLRRQIITLEPMRVDYDAAAEWSVRLCHPMPDCLYVAMSTRLQAPLVTADQKLAKALEPHGVEVQTVG
jgi:predicted nucleic acid-binding protein